MNFGSEKATKSKTGAWAKHPGCLRRRGRPGTAPRPWVLALKSGLRGFSATPGPETRLPGGVGTAPAPLGPVLVRSQLSSGAFRRRQAQRHVSLVGWALPQRPLVGSR
ncbi:hypothetical protein G5714_024703 [Onychostoma macrolepis]|uniref:Uncharacterized protein n=1 Tax=Onychostoma macrolepis TaxID=369639 RepID=A0A7J6BIS9_9TELE|nr:hypothetical protein G5714_024703 [Onychostoma macrolepis]